MSSKHSIIRLRRGTAAEWAASLPQPGGEILKLGEPGWEKDTGKLKIGDGITPWNSLAYFADGASLTIEDIQDNLYESFLIAGTGIAFVYDDGNDTLTINSTGSSGNPFDQDLNTFNSPTFDNVIISGTKIFGGGDNSGDGNGYGTIELIPDSGLYTNDQYLIVDPTGPNHIHLRAGGTQDNSNAELIVGGEKTHLLIRDNDQIVRLETETTVSIISYYFTSSSGFSSAVWETVDNTNRIVINNPNSDVYNAVTSFNSPSVFSVVDNVNNPILTITGSQTPGDPSPIILTVEEAPPSNPTNLDQLVFEINQNRNSYISVNGSDIRMEAADDVRIYSNDVFRLYNNSSSDPIEIVTDYNGDEYWWIFEADGNLQIPGNILLNNGTSVAIGTFDNNTGGNNGISLNCAVGYELNWQGGHLKNTADGGLTSANILADSAIEFPGLGVDNMEINASGLIFPDSTMQNTAASGLISDAFNTSLIASSGISLIYNSGADTLAIGISGDYIESELTTLLVGGSGIALTYDNVLDTLTISATGLALSNHNHISSNITDFNSAVSGLIPVKNILPGTNISVSNVSGVYTIESSITSVEQAASVVTTVFNKTGSPIPKMSAVYINGGQGDQPTIQLAIATGDATSAGTYGLTYETIGNMATGKVVVMGALTGLNTDQFNPTAPTGDVNGTVLYLSPTTPGGLTTTKPSAPNHIVAIGTIVRTHQNAGVIEVRVQNGYELEELHNVAISGVTNGQFLQYNSSSKLWVPSSSGNFSTLQVGGINVSVSGHTHTTSNITDFNSAVSGLLPTISNFGDNRLLTNTGSATGINAETNITFDGTNLVVSGNGKFTQLQPTVVNLGTVSGNVSTNVAAGQIFDMVLNGTTTLSNPTNAVDGVTIRWRIRQDGTGGHTVSLGSDFVIPSSASSPLPWSTAANAMDVLAATYHAGRSKWDVVAFVPGY